MRKEVQNRHSDRDPDIIADSCESLLSDGDVIKKLAELKARDEGLFEKIKSFITKLVARIKKAYAGMKPDSYEGRIVSEMVDEGERLKELFADALLDASEARASGAKVEKPGVDIMYSVGDFSSQVDAVLHGDDTNSTHLKIMDTPSLLQKAGLPSLPILMTANHLKKITSTSGHGLDIETVKKLPQYITEPVMIADSLTRDDSIVIITEAIDAENRPVIAAVLLQGNGRIDGKHIEANIMTSAYGKDNFQSFLNRIADNDSVIYWNEKKSQEMSVSLGLQLPNALTSLDSNVIIRKARAFVNSKSKENSENISEDMFSGRDPIDIEQYKKVNRQLEKENAELKEDVVEIEDDSPYSYDSLISKKDMPITVLPKTVPDNRADVVYYAKQNAAKIGKFNAKDGSVSVHVDDIDTDVALATKGLKHSLDRRLGVNAPVVLKAGEILKNSIRINEMTAQKSEAENSYILIGVANNADGDLYIVRSVVNHFNNELASIDVLYAINAKKESAALDAPRFGAKPLSEPTLLESRLRSMRPGIQPHVTDSAISIAQLLELVNRYFPDILPESVLRHFGYDARPDGDLGNSVLYSDRDSESFSSRYLLANALESAAKEGEERELLKKYQTNISELDKKHAELSEIRERANKIRYTKGRTAEQTQKSEAENSYILIGVAKNANGDLYIVRSVVNHFNKYFNKYF